jgi:hypothetical protein
VILSLMKMIMQNNLRIFFFFDTLYILFYNINEGQVLARTGPGPTLVDPVQ